MCFKQPGRLLYHFQKTSISYKISSFFFLRYLNELNIKVYKQRFSRCLYLVNSGLIGKAPTESNMIQLSNISNTANTKDLLKKTTYFKLILEQ